MQNNSKKTMKEHCNKCSGITNHYIECSFQQTHYHMEYEDIYTDEKCYILNCCGCSSTSFVRTNTFSEDPGEPYNEIFPPRTLRNAPEWISHLDIIYQKIFKEIYVALGNDCLSLATMGIRSIVDAYIAKKVGDCGTFTRGLDALLEKGHITRTTKDTLQIVVDCGNAATHRQFKPDNGTITLLMDTIELLLQQDIVAPSIKALEPQIPQRPAKKKKV